MANEDLKPGPLIAPLHAGACAVEVTFMQLLLPGLVRFDALFSRLGMQRDLPVPTDMAMAVVRLYAATPWLFWIAWTVILAIGFAAPVRRHPKAVFVFHAVVAALLALMPIAVRMPVWRIGERALEGP